MAMAAGGAAPWPSGRVERQSGGDPEPGGSGAGRPRYMAWAPMQAALPACPLRPRTLGLERAVKREQLPSAQGAFRGWSINRRGIKLRSRTCAGRDEGEDDTNPDNSFGQP